MARKKNGEPSPAKTNGFDPGKSRSFVDRIESLHADIETEMAEARNRCKSIHDDIKSVYQEAKDEAGIPKKALRSVIRVRALERKVERTRDNLDPDTLDQHDLLRHALGDLADTPLGRAAAGRELGSPA